MGENHTKESLLLLIEGMLRNDILKTEDLRVFQRQLTPDTPDAVRAMMEDWYIGMGIESIIGRRLVLSECPFSQEEIQEAHKNAEAILCVPANVSRVQLGEVFRINTWALSDPLVSQMPELKDLWFRTKMSESPIMIKATGIDISNLYGTHPYVQFSLERYLVFIGWYRHLYGKNPDQEYWIWLPRGRYDRSGMLMAGFDRFHNFNVHGWMPQFSASFLGARFGVLANSSKE